MTPFANATTPARAAQGTALSLVVGAVFLLVASNVLLLGLRLHDGGFHWSEIATGWPRYGADPRFDRWLTLSTLAGVVVVFGLLGAILRHRPLPLHGNARFASEREIKAAGLRSKEGLLLGRKDGAMLCFGGSEHVLVYAPTRAGKGVGYVIPNLLNWPHSVVVLDVKKENWDRPAGFRAAHGQEVHLFDPLDENGRTARYNPLGYVRTDPADLYDDLQRIAVMLFPAESRGDPFWFEAARSSFVAIGGYVAETPGLPLTIGEILRQLSATQDLKTHFDKIITDRKGGLSPLSRHCITALNDFLAASENTLNSVRKTVTARLGLWLNPRIDAATSTNDFDLRDDSAAKSAPTDKLSSATVQDNVFPDRIRRKYYVVANESGKDGPDGEARLYADERGEYLAFKVTEDRLVTRLAAAEVIRDMVSVAQHRQWEALDVRGCVEFRREAWLEAGARGLDVRGYQPTDLDRQALADRREVWDRAYVRTNEVEVRSASDRDERADKFDYDKGVSGRLIEVGRAPYRNRADAETSTYVAIELNNGRRHQMWGVGLEQATKDSGAKPSDRIYVRRDGVERVTKEIKAIDAATGLAGIERRQVPRNRWRVTAETFRAADRLTVARDPDLVAAQSQIVVIEKLLERSFPKDEHARQSIMEAVKEHIAQHLEKGHSFARATVMEPVRDRHPSGRDREQVRQSQSGERMRMQERER